MLLQWMQVKHYKGSLCPAERLETMNKQPQPWPAAAQAAPAFVHEGMPIDIVLKMRLWDLLSSNMIVLGEVSGPSFDDEARWREKRWLPPKAWHSKRERQRHLKKARMQACARARGGESVQSWT